MALRSISALENGEPKLMAGQAEALLDKLDRLLRLRRLPAADKHLALMFWNHPEGEKNVAASHLNVPASLARLGEALRAAGYRVATSDESALIAAEARMAWCRQPSWNQISCWLVRSVATAV